MALARVPPKTVTIPVRSKALDIGRETIYCLRSSRLGKPHRVLSRGGLSDLYGALGHMPLPARKRFGRGGPGAWGPVGGRP